MAYNRREELPRAPLRDHYISSKLNPEERHTLLNTAFRDYANNRRTINDLHWTLKVFSPTFIGPSILSPYFNSSGVHIRRDDSQLPDYSGAMLAIARANGEIDPKESPKRSIKEIIFTAPLFKRLKR